MLADPELHRDESFTACLIYPNPLATRRHQLIQCQRFEDANFSTLEVIVHEVFLARDA